MTPEGTIEHGQRARSRTHELLLLRRYHEHGDFTAREEVIERTMALVHHVARRYAQRGEQYDDLVQAGSIGLVKAVDRFDPDRGASFSSFAVPNIAGEIRRHFRDKGSCMRLPRDVQERAAVIQTATEKLENQLHRPPSTPELAEATGFTVAEVMDTLVAIRGHDLLSLDRQEDDESSGHDRHGTAEAGYARVEHLQVLRGGLEVLQERERRIIHLRFYEGLTQSEIATRIGISQMHVSRLLRQALTSMQEELRDAEPQVRAALRAADAAG